MSPRRSKALWRHNPIPQHAAARTDCNERDILFSHSDLVIPVTQVQRVEFITVHHARDDNILVRNWRLRRYCRCVQLVVRVYNTPLAVRRTQNVSALCGGLLSLTNPFLSLSSKNSSMKANCSAGGAHCRDTQLPTPGTKSISCDPEGNLDVARNSSRYLQIASQADNTDPSGFEESQIHCARHTSF